jgi:hypothetical protein
VKRAYIELGMVAVGALLTREFDGFDRHMTTDLPADLRVVHVMESPDHLGIIRFYIESESFDDVPEGDIVPRLDPHFTLHRREPLVTEDAFIG